MSAQPTSLLVLTGAFGTKLNAANAGVGFKNPDGSTNVVGTVIGVAQTTHAVVDFAMRGPNVGKWLPGTGALLAISLPPFLFLNHFSPLSSDEPANLPMQLSSLSLASNGFNYFSRLSKALLSSEIQTSRGRG